MNRSKRLMWALLCVAAMSSQARPETHSPANNERLLRRLQETHGLSAAVIESLRAIFEESGYIGQGNPSLSIHPVSESDCRDALGDGTHGNSELYMDICGRPYMAPLYDPDTESPRDATACIDQFEFPNIPCVYPVVWVRASEATRICEVLGKRLCDAHEWEGACEGRLLPPDYRFDLAAGRDPQAAVGWMRDAHNRLYRPARSWSYGPDYRTDVCATSGAKTKGCDGGSFRLCGSNTFPSGSFPDCRSPLDVYDLHGNVAEHMNLPLEPGQMASLGSRTYGYTEMKGSWFVFGTTRAHDDWCRWRAPFWHGSRILDPKSHRNYHLGFRCCETVGDESAGD